MTFLRPASSLRTALLRPVASPIARPALPIATQRFASGYGDGKGDPVAEQPQKQPASKSRDLEHPGPPPPDVGKGSDASAASHKDTDSKSQNNGGETSSSGSHKGQKVKGAQPKILNANPPSEESADVKQHNKEMDNRAERAETKISNKDAEKDKVPPSFWSGKQLQMF